MCKLVKTKNNRLVLKKTKKEIENEKYFKMKMLEIKAFSAILDEQLKKYKGQLAI